MASPSPHSPMASTSPHLETIISRLSNYNFIFDTHAKRIRGLPKDLRKDAEKKWEGMAEFYRPRPDDEVARAKFFTAVDNACKMECLTPESCYIVVFACSAGVTILNEQDISWLEDVDQVQVFRKAQQMAWEQVLSRDAKESPTIQHEQSEVNRVFMLMMKPKNEHP